MAISDLRPPQGVRFDQAALAIYDDAYAARYPGLYLHPWPHKHALNLKLLDALLAEAPGGPPRWLDLACGQAWHFSAFEGRAEMTGVDLSEAQLARARRNAPHARFVRADMAELDFRPGAFDLVTNFWGGYCYLADRGRIEALWRKAAGWIAPGGALYVEVLLGEDLASFNRSQFAGRTGFSVSPLSEDYGEWLYQDCGGAHVMTSPPLQAFVDLFAPEFRSVETRHDGMFMVHLLAQGRL